MSTIKRSLGSVEITTEKDDFSTEELLYTDQFFKFPTYIYLTDDVNQSEKFSELGIEGVVPELEGAVGWVRCYVEDIVTWHDSFSRPRTIEDVKRNGFDMTHVILRNGEEFTTHWKREKFEAKMNEHMKRLQDKMFEKVDTKFRDTLNKVIEEQEVKMAENKKKPWWKRLF